MGSIAAPSVMCTAVSKGRDAELIQASSSVQVAASTQAVSSKRCDRGKRPFAGAVDDMFASQISVVTPPCGCSCSSGWAPFGKHCFRFSPCGGCVGDVNLRETPEQTEDAV